MDLEIFLRYVHFLSILLIAGTLVAERVLLKPEMTRAELNKLSQVDLIYGLAALSLVGAGLTLWLGSIGKPAVFYTNNWIFITKISLFVVVGLLSIYPTIFFLKNRKGNASEVVTIPKIISGMVTFEIIILLILPLLAGLMARGIGYTI
jgi:putative membrane protein